MTDITSETPETADVVRSELQTALQQVEGSTDGTTFERVWNDIVGRYREPHRRYHNLRHVERMLTHALKLADAVNLNDTSAVVLAAVWHDVIYDPTRHDNEEASAVLAHTHLARLNVSPAVRTQVADLIRMTAGHHADPDDLQQAVLADADLAALADIPEDYQAVNDAIRIEYQHVSDVLWQAGRSQFINDFLERPAIFTTDVGRQQFEGQARDNLQQELQSLTN